MTGSFPWVSEAKNKVRESNLYTKIALQFLVSEFSADNLSDKVHLKIKILTIEVKIFMGIRTFTQTAVPFGVRFDSSDEGDKI